MRPVFKNLVAAVPFALLLQPISAFASTYTMTLNGRIDDIVEATYVGISDEFMDWAWNFDRPPVSRLLTGSQFMLGDVFTAVYTYDTHIKDRGNLSADGYQWTYLNMVKDAHVQIGAEFSEHFENGTKSVVNGRNGVDLASLSADTRNPQGVFTSLRSNFIDTAGRAISDLAPIGPQSEIWDSHYQTQLAFVFPNRDQLHLSFRNASISWYDSQTVVPVPLPASGWLLFGAIGAICSFRKFGRLRAT